MLNLGGYKNKKSVSEWVVYLGKMRSLEFKVVLGYQERNGDFYYCNKKREFKKIK